MLLQPCNAACRAYGMTNWNSWNSMRGSFYQCRDHCMEHADDGSWGNNAQYYVEDAERARQFCIVNNYNGFCDCKWSAWYKTYQCHLTSNGRDFQGNLLILNKNL